MCVGVCVYVCVFVNVVGMQEREIEQDLDEKKTQVEEMERHKEWEKGREERVDSWKGFKKDEGPKRAVGVKRREDIAFGSVMGKDNENYKKKCASTMPLVLYTHRLAACPVCRDFSLRASCL